MLKRIEVELPQCEYHGPETVAARKAAEVGIAGFNAKACEFETRSQAILNADPAEIDAAELFPTVKETEGAAPAMKRQTVTVPALPRLMFEALQAELKARRLVAEFFKLHRRDSQAVVQSLPAHQGAVSESERTASHATQCPKHYDNINAMSALESQLREIVKTYLAA